MSKKSRIWCVFVPTVLFLLVVAVAGYFKYASSPPPMVTLTVTDWGVGSRLSQSPNVRVIDFIHTLSNERIKGKEGTFVLSKIVFTLDDQGKEWRYTIFVGRALPAGIVFDHNFGHRVVEGVEGEEFSLSLQPGVTAVFLF